MKQQQQGDSSASALLSQILALNFIGTSKLHSVTDQHNVEQWHKMDHKAPHKKGGLFQLEFTNTFQLKQEFKELKRKRNNNNKENSLLNKSNVVSRRLKDFHRYGIGVSS